MNGRMVHFSPGSKLKTSQVDSSI